MVCDHSDFWLEVAKRLGMEVCNNERENLKKKAMFCLGEANSVNVSTADADIYIDAVGAEAILAEYQAMGKFESRMVVVAVLAGMRSVNILGMTYAQHVLIGSGGYMLEDVRDVMEIMKSGRWDIESLITHEYP